MTMVKIHSPGLGVRPRITIIANSTCEVISEFRFRVSCSAVLLYVLVLSTPVEAADWKPHCERSSGTYRVVALELSEGLRFEGKNRKVQPPQTVHLAFRDEKLTAWWFMGHGWEAIHQHACTTTLTSNGIKGGMNLRMYDVRGRLQLVADLFFSVARQGDLFRGSFRAKVTGVVKRSWNGKAVGTFLQPANEFAAAASWPNFAGPKGTLSTSPGGPPLISDLGKSRPLWRSEAAVPV